MDDRRPRYCSRCGEELAAGAEVCPSCRRPVATEGDSFPGWVKQGGRYLGRGVAALASLAVVVVIVGGTLMSTYGDLIEWAGEKAGVDLGMLNPGPDNDCEGFGPWYDESFERMAGGDQTQLLAKLDEGPTVDDIRRVALRLNEIADQQARSGPPAAAAEANRLAVLQLRTTADALNAFAGGEVTRSRELISESESLDDEYRAAWDRVRRKCS